MQAIHVLEPAIVTVHASGGRAMMEDAKAAAGENTKVVGVTVLTSFDDKDLSRIGINDSPHDAALRLADLSHQAGLDGIVCSGHEVGDIHRQWKDGFFVVPGSAPAQRQQGRPEAHRYPARSARQRRVGAGDWSPDPQR